MWNPADGSFKRLTDSERHHYQPACSDDGKRIYFMSGSDLYAYGGLWSLDRKTGRERSFG
jgi:Tol biopolymer transport system component